MTNMLERVLSASIGLSAVVIAASLAHREFVRPSRAPARPARASAYVEAWKDLLPVGRASGNASAKITLVEFSDLECPFCKRFNATVQSIVAKYPGDINRVFIHLPLSMHRFAIPAARAAECAADAGRFEPMVNAVFGKQDSLGLKSWVSYAVDAGVRDTLAFARCVQQSGPVRGVDAGRKAGEQLGVSGTPTILLNGWKYGSPPSEEELETAIKSLLAGRPPYPTYPVAFLQK